MKQNCGKCGNTNEMKILKNFDEIDHSSYVDEIGELQEYTHLMGTYHFLKCSICESPSLWHSNESVPDSAPTLLWPIPEIQTQHLPKKIQKFVETAYKIKPIDKLLFCVQIRRTLELVCVDQGFIKGNLWDKITDLSEKLGYPNDTIKRLGSFIKNVGNDSVHPANPEPSQRNIYLQERIMRVLLEHLYTFPAMLKQTPELKEKT